MIRKAKGMLVRVESVGEDLAAPAGKDGKDAPKKKKKNAVEEENEGEVAAVPPSSELSLAPAPAAADPLAMIKKVRIAASGGVSTDVHAAGIINSSSFATRSARRTEPC